MKPCSVCTHRDLEEIDRALTLGHPVLRLLAKEKALSKTSLLRHKGAHLGQRPAAASNTVPTTASDAAPEADLAADGDSRALVHEIRGVCADARRLARKAEKRGDIRGAIAAINSRANSLEKLMKLLIDAERTSRPTTDNLFASAWRTASTMAASNIARALASRGPEGQAALARQGAPGALAELDALPPASAGSPTP